MAYRPNGSPARAEARFPLEAADELVKSSVDAFVAKATNSCQCLIKDGQTTEAVQLPVLRGWSCKGGKMAERTGGPWHGVLRVAWASASPSRMTSPLPGHLRPAHTFDGIEIAVDAAQQVDQHFALVFLEAGQQSSLAFERGEDDLVVGGASFRGQRNRMGASVVRRGPDCHHAPLLQQRQRAAHRPLVESDDVADTRGRDAGLDRQQRHDPPFRDVDAEILLIEHGRAVRQLVGDEGDERRNVAVEIEGRTGVAAYRRSGRIGRSVLAHDPLNLALMSPATRSRNRDTRHSSATTLYRRPSR